MEEQERFPFLELEGTSSPEELITEWIFLNTNSGVGKDDNVKLLVDILVNIKYSNFCLETPINRYERLLELYAAIYVKYLGSMNQQAEMTSVKESFDEYDDLIFVPAQGDQKETWAEPNECLWEAPLIMTTKHPLKNLYKYSLDTDKMIYLSYFLQQILSIPNASYSDLTMELEHPRESGCENFDQILALYEYLHEMETSAVADKVRQEFATKNIIFVVNHGKPGWYKSSECLWSSTTEIQGKVTLNDHYEGLKDFFIDTLNVTTLTLQMVYDELLQIGSQRTVEEVKDIIRSFNALLQTEADKVDPAPLLKACVFLVDYPNGTVILRSADTEFAIADRNYLTDYFKDKIKLLDYDLEEVRQLKPFFEWANLTHRYLSVVVKEITSISDGVRRPISVSDRDLKRKAHALLRIAATFDSPRYRDDATGLYQLLRTADVVETNGILSMLSIVQDGRPVEVEVAVGDVHIDEALSVLTIYVPANKRKQAFCFSSPLLMNLADWLMRDSVIQIRDEIDNTLITALTALLTIEIFAVDLILDRQGIIQVPILNEDIEAIESDDVETLDPLDDDNGSSLRSMTPDTSPSGQLIGYAEARNTSNNGTCDESLSSISEQVVTRQSHMSRHSSVATYSRPEPIPSPHPRLTDDNAPYRLLLNKVLAAARNATFPSSGTFDMTGLINALPEEHSFEGFDGLNVRTRFRSDNQLERDRKVGAAGELYAFELLSRLDPSLQNWSRDNWQSTIRRYVRVHPDYADLEPWHGRDTADITYDDTEGDLTAMLIDRGYLDHDDWEDARPRYYIEVKTTTGPCRTPFYMSKHQYQRMQNVHNENQRSKVYMILRVFEIESSEINMRVYLDPEQLRLDESLLFTGETWSVVPE
ncbi:hypothetical protein PT974_03165 [Cladobotryum mycophilum]|uniref:Protein NO VEIN C-terminal domain-containing protein n=1 Tax=Cladobotryum mycophilum TaxID=491253 RepID=A0ABR0SRI6_9HYPO